MPAATASPSSCITTALGADAIGGGGGAKGAQGIANGLAISLDTYSNAGEPASDYTAIFDTDAAAGTTLTNKTSLSNLENSQWHNVKVSWNAANADTDLLG